MWTDVNNCESIAKAAMRTSKGLFVKLSCSLCFRSIFFVMLLVFSASPCLGTSQEVIVFIGQIHQSWQIFQVTTHDTDIKQIITTEHDVLKLSLAFDGQKLLFITSDGKTFVLNLKTNERVDIEINMKGMVDTVLSKDEKSLLFSLSSGGSRDANHIWHADMMTKKTTQLTHMEERQYHPIWSHDDSSIFFISGAGRQNYDIWRLDVESGSLNQLTAGQLYNFEPSCSVNDEIAFSSNRSGNYEIWAMDPFGGNVRQLTHDLGVDSQPSWSPDGEHLVFVSNRDGHSALYIMDRDGKNIRRLSPEGLICRNPAWGR